MRQPGETVLHKGGIDVQIPCDHPFSPSANAQCHASETIDRAIRIAEDQLCPVLAMLRPGTQIISSWQMD
jgi:hypothetical protein